VLAALLAMQGPAFAQNRAHSFNVLNHRSIALTAQYWNPILSYVSQKSGVPLELQLNKTSKENTAKAETGIYDFLYTNHFFTPERDRLGYRVIARLDGPGIRGQVVVAAESPVRDLRELDAKEVAFPTPDGFTGYWLPMDALLNSGVHVKPVITGNQETSIGLLRREEVSAAGVNSGVLEHFSRRTGFQYRVLWSSPLYNDLCIMANPRVSKASAAAVKAAFLGMSRDAQGRKILASGAELLKIEHVPRFVTADNRDYDSYRAFYRQSRVKAASVPRVE
jgi:phosphonate transport system substrate-binding protein